MKRFFGLSTNFYLLNQFEFNIYNLFLYCNIWIQKMIMSLKHCALNMFCERQIKRNSNDVDFKKCLLRTFLAGTGVVRWVAVLLTSADFANFDIFIWLTVGLGLVGVFVCLNGVEDFFSLSDTLIASYIKK